MSQSKKGSFIEAWANVAIGFGINYGANIIFLPILWDPAQPYKAALYIGIAFTFISVIRSFVLRRLFNKVKAKWNQGEQS